VTRGSAPLVASLFVLLSGCEAGPSAFDRPPAGLGIPDTADVGELPDIPEALDVEVPGGVVAEPPEADVVPGSDSGPSVPEADSTSSGAGDLTAADSLSGANTGFERPAHIRGLYLNAWASGSRSRVSALLDIARRTEINAFVIDIKDATGYVSHRSEVPMAREIGATEEIRIRDLPGLLALLAREGIYPIARMVLVKDPLLSTAYPDMAVQDTAGGVFVDRKGIVWLNPYDQRMWDYHVDLAREVAELGFPEIQWDYVRFPDISTSEKARTVYPGAGEMLPEEAIRSLLEYTREALEDLDVEVTADVFGMTTSASRDIGIGQVWELVIDQVDAALPMVYPSHYWSGSFGYEEPNAYPYEVVKRALEDALRRSAEVDGAGTTRPWLQAFTLGKPRYEVPEVRAQIQGAYDAGIQEWILWNPGSRYDERALEPVHGFVTEPLMRVAGQVVEVSRRHAVIDSLKALADSIEAAEQRWTDSIRAAELADTVRAGGG
jgi:hypothetical protein